MHFGFGDCELDTERHTLRCRGQPVSLEPKALQVLVYLVQQHGRAVTMHELCQEFYPGPSDEYKEYALRNCLYKIRQVVGDAGTQGRVIETLRGYGYRFAAPVTLRRDADDRPPEPPSPFPRLSGQRQLTVLRCTLVVPPRLEHLSADDFQTILQPFYTACDQAMQPFAGAIAHYASDELLVYFGYPSAQEDAPQRAVRAGLVLREAVQRLVLPREHAPGLRLAVRLSIHTGQVAIDEPRAPTPGPPVVSGIMLSVAKRLHERATPDTLLISADTYRLVQGYFVCEALETQHSSSDDALHVLYRVLAEHSLQNRFDGVTARGLTPLVGRDAEIALLLDRWEQVKEGRGQVVLINGEPGIGKSRLAQVLRERIEPRGYVRIEFRCSPYYQNSAFYPVLSHLQRVLGFRRDESPEAKLAKLERLLQTYRFAHQEVLPLLAALFSLPHPARYPPLSLSPEQQKRRTQEALVAWLCEEAERQSVLVVWEDLHWLDPSSLEWLTLLMDQTATARLLLLLTARLEFRPPWGSRAHLTQLALPRFTRPQVEELVLRITDGKRLPAEVVQQVIGRTDGVPLFVEELTKMVLESAWLAEGVEQYELTSPLPPLAIPATLEGSLLARLDRLPTAKEVAQWGATIGRQFTHEQLQAVAPWDAATLQHELTNLVAAELLFVRGEPPQATYVFKHALIQDAAYQAMLRRTRQQIHQRIAHVWETQFPETCALSPELVAHHYTEAGLHAQALPYWQRAGQHAIERSANIEAISHLTKGLEVLETLPATPERIQQELALQLALNTALKIVKGLTAPEVHHTCTRVQDLCQQVSDTAQRFSALVRLWGFHFPQGRLPRAQPLAEQCFRLAQRLQDPALLQEAHQIMGSTLMHLGVLGPARTHLEQAAAIDMPPHYHPLHFDLAAEPGVMCRAYLGWLLWLLGYPEQALRWSREALTRAQASSHLYTLGFAWHYAVVLHQCRREAPLVHKCANILITQAQEQAFGFRLAGGLIERGWALAEQGMAQAGVEQIGQGLGMMQHMGTEMFRPYWLVLLAEVLWKAGQLEEGLHGLAEALTMIHNNAERFYEAEVYRLQGELLWRVSAENHRTAAECLWHAIDIARSQQAKSLELRAVLSLSGLWQQQGKRADARRLLKEIYTWFTEGFDTPDLQQAKVLLDAL